MNQTVAGMILGLAMLTGGLLGCQSLDSQNGASSLPASQSVAFALVNPDSLASLEQAIYEEINRYRQTRKLPPLKLNSDISRYARIHSERMAAGIVSFSHDGFEKRVQSIGQIIPYEQAAENLSVNVGYIDPVKVAVQGWIASSGHRKNLEGEFDLTGIGVARNASGEYYFTQIFLKQRYPRETNTVEAGRWKSPVPTKNSPLDSSLLITIEQEVYRQVNQYRLSRNLAPLRLDARLSYEARLYSQKMARGEAPFSHDGREERFKKVGRIVPYRKAAENLAVNKVFADPGSVAVEGWIRSSGHRQNMEGKFNVTGIGVAKNHQGEYYLTQFFILKR
ncbi:uncharacterized protein with SCP/PR1 domains [Pleurocapsa sp. PCC 7327]|uniref:CAP domain-containing protein n=1 Tax=Pleurocapsa sp. PCC 7327 TaxID=118163 RepID=UPI00029F995E|nr:CAP domain-containing protein [Pleurocapsa sp. PCC 7327]AFY76115.1 uncharacterized protein with SCP/PR1 domains [Pleurocapsa sp. PCC 7327]